MNDFGIITKGLIFYEIFHLLIIKPLYFIVVAYILSRLYFKKYDEVRGGIKIKKISKPGSYGCLLATIRQTPRECMNKLKNLLHVQSLYSSFRYAAAITGDGHMPPLYLGGNDKMMVKIAKINWERLGTSSTCLIMFQYEDISKMKSVLHDLNDFLDIKGITASECSAIILISRATPISIFDSKDYVDRTSMKTLISMQTGSDGEYID